MNEVNLCKVPVGNLVPSLQQELVDFPLIDAIMVTIRTRRADQSSLNYLARTNFRTEIKRVSAHRNMSAPAKTFNRDQYNQKIKIYCTVFGITFFGCTYLKLMPAVFTIK